MADDPTASVEIEIRVRMEALEKDLAEVKAMLEAFNNSTKDTSSAFEKLEQRFSTSAQQLAEYNKNMKVVNDALASGATTAERAAEVQKKLALQYGQATIAQQLFAQTSKGVSNQLTAIAGGAGAVGTFLAGIGPWGLAAAVGLGAVADAFHYISEESKRMGDRAIDIKRFTDVTGLTVSQLKAIGDAATDMGISSDGVKVSFERLVRLMEGASRASGPLFEELQRSDPILAEAIANTDDYAKRIDLLAKAYVNASTAGQKALIAQAAFGRHGASQGPILAAVDAVGGIANVKANTVLEEQTKLWANLRIQTEDMEKSAKNIFASIFTEQGLQAAHSAAKAMKEAALAAKDLATMREDLNWFQSFWVALNNLVERDGEELKRFNETMKQVAKSQRDVAAKDVLKEAMGAPTDRLRGTAFQHIMGTVPEAIKGIDISADPQSLKSWLDLADHFHKVGAAAESAAAKTKLLDDQTKAGRDLASRISKAFDEQVAFMGTAATFDQIRAARLAKLNTLYADHKTGINAANTAEQELAKTRAESAINLDVLIQKEGARLSILGNMASVAEIVAQKERDIQAARARGTKITDDEAAAIVENTRQQQLGITGIRQHTMSLELEAQTMEMSAGAATRFRMIHEQLNKARLEGRKLTEAEVAEITRWADKAGDAAGSAEKLKVALEIKRDRQTMFLSDEDVQIADKLKGLYPQVGQALASPEAAMMRVNVQFKQMRDMTSEFASGFALDMMHGVKATEALHNALQKLADSLLKMATDKLVKASFSALFDSATKGVTAAAGGAVAEGGAKAATEGAIKGGAEAAGGAATSAEMVAAGAAAGDAIAAGAITGAGALNGAAVEMDALLGPMFATAASGLAGAGLELELLGPMFATVSTGLTGASFELGTASAGLTASAAALTSAAAALAAANVGKAAVGVLHSGGIIGESAGATRAVNPAIFAGAPRFHGGGVVGDEVPIIAKKGERVQTKEQQRADKGGGGQDQSPQISLTQHNTFIGADPASEARLRQALEKTKNLAVAEAVSAVIKQRSNNPNMFR